MVSDNTVELVDGRAPPPFIPSKRFTLALLVFFAGMVQYSQRGNVPIAIVCIVNRTKVFDSPLPLNATSRATYNIREDIPNPPATTLKPATNPVQKGGFFEEKQFYWNELQQQILLGGYWAGYIFTQVPGGWLATILGAKWVYAVALGTSSLATLAMTLMYFMSNTHFYLILILRIVVGLSHGVFFPATIALWSVWAVPQERSTLASIGFCGTHLGTSVTMLIGGVFCRYFYAGWMYIFFASGILGFIWLILWVLLTADAPNHHKTISAHEREYICSLTGSSGKKRTMSLASIPWNKIIRSKPLIGLMITHNANLFGLFFFLTNLGKIVNELLSVPPQYTGYILAFGFFLTLLTSLSSGILVDYLVRTDKTTLTNARKIFNSLTSFIPIFCMATLCFCDKSRQILGVVAVLILLASSGLGYGSAYIVNFADIVPAYSGVIFGIANTLASLAGLIGNIVAGAIVKQPVLEQWRVLFIMFGVVYFIGGVVYIIYGSAEPRKWAKFQVVNTATEEKRINEEETIPMNDEK